MLLSQAAPVDGQRLPVLLVGPDQVASLVVHVSDPIVRAGDTGVARPCLCTLDPEQLSEDFQRGNLPRKKSPETKSH